MTHPTVYFILSSHNWDSHNSVEIRVAEPPDFRRLRLRPSKNKTAPSPAPGELYGRKLKFVYSQPTGPQPVQIVQPMYRSAKQNTNIHTYRQYTRTRPRLGSTKINILIFFTQNNFNNNDYKFQKIIIMISFVFLYNGTA